MQIGPVSAENYRKVVMESKRGDLQKDSLTQRRVVQSLQFDTDPDEEKKKRRRPEESEDYILDLHA